MPPQRIFPQQFMHLSHEMRTYFTQMWKIPRSGISEIRDQTVVSDGHTYDDLAVITHELMEEYIGSKESFARAWELSCMKAHSELHPPVGGIGKQFFDDTKLNAKDVAALNRIVDDKEVLTEEKLNNAEKQLGEPPMGADGKPAKAPLI